MKVLNVESGPELARVSIVARRLGVRAPIALRVNPDVDPKTHPYISTGLRENKFGVSVAEARRLYALRRQGPGARGRRRRLPHRLADHRPSGPSSTPSPGCSGW